MKNNKLADKSTPEKLHTKAFTIFLSF